MARIAGVNLPNDKKIDVALTYLYGIGLSLSIKILDELKVDRTKRVKELNDEEVNKLRNEIEKKYRVEGELRRDVLGNIKRLKEISCYRGSRHTKNLPVRGQCTRTNSRTVRGNKRHTVGSGRKPSAQKT